MSAIEVQGLCPIKGEIIVQGSKNAVLPMMAGAVLNKGITVIDNVPRIQDVFCMMGILDSLGCSCVLDGHSLTINAAGLSRFSIPREEMEKMRSSIMLLGALLGRCKEAEVYYPGGCMIGKRPIDLHLMALEKMGVLIEEGEGDEPLRASVPRLRGTVVDFPFPSVGATENAIFAAVAASGKTILKGCAKEPEITELCRFMNNMGASIRGAGSDLLVIEGGLPLHDSRFTVCGDRIAGGTYLLAAAGAGGELLLTGTESAGLLTVTTVLKRMGALVYAEDELIYVKAPERLQASSIKTDPYPGFPTDLQSIMMAVMSRAEGTSIIEEKIFENRFKTAVELEKLGAEIIVEEDIARIVGHTHLKGSHVEAKDLRGGAALVAAGMMAEGTTIVSSCEYIMRGYEDICRDLSGMGACIRYVEEPAGR
ncbi:UDP-N-acetylglucosamine 1-carboxyvinyltransferase [Clostridium transplantifaecale]|uniref:UDP-N-acetylglucosamine 1-carboxyvinyltransferase n=1 Tax=Clostridium transplantifaecale TaxID=2479838 RepID=UPI000F63C0F3|nr:UDP-N-acetylglucosamine 1-carboxyvinyltransferase [Clostridium transplantifaecale]